VVRRAARAAEDEGDLLGAERLLSLLPTDPTVRRWRTELAARRRLQDSAAPYSRGLCLLGPAQRWAADGAARAFMLELAQTALSEQTSTECRAGDREAVTATAAEFDPLVADVVLFDKDLFSRYLHEALAPFLLLDCGPVSRWGAAPGAVFEVVAGGPEHHPTTLRRCGLGSAAGGSGAHVAPNVVSVIGPVAAAGELVYGRPVPTGTGECVLALPPVVLNPVHAGRVQRALLRRSPATERVRLLARARSCA